LKTPHIWMPLFIGDLDAAFKTLSHDEESALIRLLMAYWTNGELPPDEKLPKLLGLSSVKWRAVKVPVLHAFAVYCERTDMDGQRLKAAKYVAQKQQASNNRWQRYRRNATQGLDADAYAHEHASAYHLHLHPNQKEKKGATEREQPETKGSTYTPTPRTPDQDRALHGGPDSGLGSQKPNGKYGEH
jgi:uncharacterized protein YdaU (DUF1376 family)